MLCLHQITEAFHDWSQKRSSFTGWVMAAMGCMVQRSIAQARTAGSRSLNRRFSKSCREGPLVSSVLTAVGRFTMSGSVYPDALGTLGITVIVPTEADQADVDRIIFDELIDGVLEPRSRGRYVEVIDELESRGADAVALACTEIPLLVTPDVSPLPTLDSTRLLASAALTRAIGATRTSRSH